MKLQMLVKDINIKTLVSGDKQGRITFETLYPKDVDEIVKLSSRMEVYIDVRTNESNDIKSDNG